MKSIVIYDDFRLPDFKPSSLINEYLKLVEKDVQTYFLEEGNLKSYNCPGCLSKEISSSFIKFGLHYLECAKCNTLRVSPRPDDILLQRFYKESQARKYWRDKLSVSTKNKRREKIIKPRYEWIADSTSEYLPDAEHILDVNTNQDGSVNEIVSLKEFQRKTLLNPLVSIHGSNLAGIDILDVPIQDVELNNEVDVVTLFEVADRTSDVELLFKKINRILKKEGLCFLTAILVSGFDLQVLQDKADNIFPPDRLNVFSVEGIKSLFKRHGFACIEFSTPGVLDMEIIARTIKENPTIKIPKFVKYMLKNRSFETRKTFQEFLESALMSSYGRILIRKI